MKYIIITMFMLASIGLSAQTNEQGSGKQKKEHVKKGKKASRKSGAGGPGLEMSGTTDINITDSAHRKDPKSKRSSTIKKGPGKKG